MTGKMDGQILIPVWAVPVHLCGSLYCAVSYYFKSMHASGLILNDIFKTLLAARIYDFA